LVILVAGETLIDRVVRPDGTTSDHPGGGPFNSARTIGRLGVPVRLLSVVGRDPAGDLCLEALTQSHVDTALVQRIDLATTLAVATLNEAGAASYVFDFETSAARHLEGFELPADIDYLHVGTLALVLEPFATAVHEAIDALPGRVALLVDPNCRPSVVGNPDLFIAHVRAALARADIIKISDDDLDFLRSLDPTFPSATEWIATGASCVLFTRGSAGVDVIGKWGTTTVAAPRVTVTDTVGAGDSLSGAFLAWCSERQLGREGLGKRELVVAAAEFAVRVAAITVSRAGAEPPTRDDLRDFYFSA
jgi:fructokinase